LCDKSECEKRASTWNQCLAKIESDTELKSNFDRQMSSILVRRAGVYRGGRKNRVKVTDTSLDNCSFQQQSYIYPPPTHTFQGTQATIISLFFGKGKKIF
jgi:hypothetical protein